VAHTQIFAFNLFFAMMLISILSIIPGQGFNTEIHFTWSGIQVWDYSIGSFDVVLTPLNGFAVLVAAIVTVTILCVVATLKFGGEIFGTGVSGGLDFSPFKLTALIIGVVFVSVIAGMEILLMSPMPLALQFILIFPTQIMMVYALVIDIGTYGGG
jgi:hypothetical protein